MNVYSRKSLAIVLSASGLPTGDIHCQNPQGTQQLKMTIGRETKRKAIIIKTSWQQRKRPFDKEQHPPILAAVCKSSSAYVYERWKNAAFLPFVVKSYINSFQLHSFLISCRKREKITHKMLIKPQTTNMLSSLSFYSYFNDIFEINHCEHHVHFNE